MQTGATQLSVSYKEICHYRWERVGIRLVQRSQAPLHPPSTGIPFLCRGSPPVDADRLVVEPLMNLVSTQHALCDLTIRFKLRDVCSAFPHRRVIRLASTERRHLPLVQLTGDPRQHEPWVFNSVMTGWRLDARWRHSA